jgi:glutamyl-tRNA synthetase
MHIGNLRTALYAYLYAKHNGGDFILRIEDTDKEREVEGAIDLIYRTLRESDILPDEGPLNPGKAGPYIQSERKALYKEYAEKLVQTGGAYYCFCSKERLQSLTDEKGNRKYDKHCLSLNKDEIAKRLAAGEEYVIRQNIPSAGKTVYTDGVFGEIAVDCEDLEDNILLKSDGMPTYNFANVIDDRLMGITDILRGTEYLSSTPKYNLIYQSFGWETPRYMHLPPIMKDAQIKLSKRYGDANFEDFTEKGYLPEAIVNYIALLGWSPKNNAEKMTLSDLIALFSVEGISKSGSILNEEKMKWLNAQYIKELPFEAFRGKARPYYEKSVIRGKYDYDKFSKLLQSRIEVLGDIPEKVKFIDDFGAFDTELFVHQKMKTDLAVAKTAVEAAIQAFETLRDFSETAIHDALIAKSEEIGLKKGQMLWSVRVALTGQPSTPGGAVEMADILGKEEALRRPRFSKTLT